MLPEQTVLVVQNICILCLTNATNPDEQLIFQLVLVCLGLIQVMEVLRRNAEVIAMIQHALDEYEREQRRLSNRARDQRRKRSREEDGIPTEQGESVVCDLIDEPVV